MNLDELTALENEWLAKMSGETSSGHGDAWWQNTDVYDAWRMIFHQYVLLAREGNLEALERGLFLAWYGQAEPPGLCGIKHLDGGLVEEVLHMVNSLVEKDQLDEELTWMLPWYYHVAEWYLDPHDDLEALKQASKGDWHAYDEGCLESSFANRGQLGEYWRSIQMRFRPIKGLGGPLGDQGPF
jgi:hypothetical protein